MFGCAKIIEIKAVADENYSVHISFILLYFHFSHHFRMFSLQIYTKPHSFGNIFINKLDENR